MSSSTKGETLGVSHDQYIVQWGFGPTQCCLRVCRNHEWVRFSCSGSNTLGVRLVYVLNDVIALWQRSHLFTGLLVSAPHASSVPASIVRGCET